MNGKKSTILIVDDEKQVIELLVTHFRRRGYEPIATVNPTIVEQALETYQVHLVVLDLRMERRGGYEILESLRQKKIKTPVLIMTAYMDQERDRLKTLGITEDDVIKKPFGDFTEAEALINKALNKVVMPGEVGSEYEDKIYRNNKTKLLIVDDEVEINEILKDDLEARRYEVKCLTKGDAALEYIKQNECHVAIVDMKIPGLAGHELIKEVLRIKPSLKIIPFSGAYAKEMRDLLASVGFDPETLITKPFDLNVLIERIKVLATEANTLNPGKTVKS